MKRFLVFFLWIAFSRAGFGQAVDSARPKLIVDDGEYHESNWTHQMDVTADDKYLLVSDFSNGIRIYEVQTGALINSFVGHALEGDMYFDERNDILVSTGDKKIKIWDIGKQTQIGEINQDFHTQFMNNVYIDSKKKYVFAENVKYELATKKVVKKYPFGEQMPQFRMLFYKDKYYLFNKEQGTLKSFDVYNDQPVSVIRIQNYEKGYQEVFNSEKGLLFIGYSTGVLSIDVTTGRSERIAVDRSHTYDNLDIGSNYNFSWDRRFFMASSNQENAPAYSGHFAVLRKDGTNGSYQEVYRDSSGIADEIVSLHHSDRCIVSMHGLIELFDLDSLKPVWIKKPTIEAINSINIGKDPRYLNINFGERYFHNKIIGKLLGGKISDTVRKLFDWSTIYWGSFNRGLTAADIPLRLMPLWTLRELNYSIDMLKGFSGKEIRRAEDYFQKATIENPYGTIAGKVYSPSGSFYAVEKSFKAVTFFKNDASVVSAPTTGVIYHIEYSKDERYAAFGGSDRTVTVVDLEHKKPVHALWGKSYITAICFSDDDKYIFSGSLKNQILMHDIATGKLVKTFDGCNGSISDVNVTENGKILLSVSGDNALRFWDVQKGTLLLTVFYDRSLHYLAFTPDGYFDKSKDFEGSIGWNINGSLIDFNQLYENYYRPDIVQAILSGGDLSRYASQSIQNGIASPPTVTVEVQPDLTRRGAIVGSDGPVTTDNPEALLKVSARSTGGGVKGIRIYNNGKLVFEDLGAAGGELFNREYKVVLSNGMNQLRVIGFSRDMTESRPAFARVVGKFAQRARPDMYVVSIGIDKYRNGRYDLNYCVADMQGFDDIMSQRAKALFGNVVVRPISNEDANRENILHLFSELKAIVKPEDVFVLFYAGHGIALDTAVNGGGGGSDFFYVLNDVIQMSDPEKVAKEGISGAEMRALLSGIKAGKQVMFIDACNSGVFADEFKMRGAAEENALAKLSRSTGTVVFASTTASQAATEFAQLKHGVFTYSLIEAIQGKGALGNRQLTVAGIKAFIDDEIPVLTKRYGGTAQYPMTFIWGQDFPIGMVDATQP